MQKRINILFGRSVYPINEFLSICFCHLKNNTPVDLVISGGVVKQGGWCVMLVI